MSTDKDLEKAFKKLNHASSQVRDEMWLTIQVKLKRKRRIIIFFFISTMFVLLAFSIAIIDRYKKNEDTTIARGNKILINNSSNNKENILNKMEVERFKTNNKKEKTGKYKYQNKILTALHQNKLNPEKDIVFNQLTTLNNAVNKIDNNKIIDSINLKNKNIKNNNLITDNKNLPADNSDNVVIKTEEEDNTVHDPLSLLIFVSPDFPFQQLNYTDSAGLFVKSNSFMRVSYSVGTRVQYQFSKHFSGSLGVQYSQVNNKIKAGNETILTKYKTFDLPLLAGYSFSSKNFYATFNAGIILNIMASRKSNISDTLPYPYYLQKDDAYKNNSSVSYYAGLNLEFKTDKKINFFAEPYFKYRPSNIVKPSASFQQKINTAGILIGIKYNLFNKSNPDSSAP